MFKGTYNLNIIAWRNPNGRLDAFDDALEIIYDNPEGETIRRLFRDYTTDPGSYYLEHPMHAQGTATMALGFHRAAYTFGRHKGRYEALVPTRPLPVIRDGGLLSTSSTVNMHHADGAKRIGRYSAGCQVHRTEAALEEVLWLCHKQVEAGFGSKFSYNLKLGIPT